LKLGKIRVLINKPRNTIQLVAVVGEANSISSAQKNTKYSSGTAHLYFWKFGKSDFDYYLAINLSRILD